MNFKNSILIFGYGITGKSCHNYLIKNYPDLRILIYDDKLENNFKAIAEHKIEFIIKSPGISPNHEILKEILNKNKNCQVINDIELFYNQLCELDLLNRVKIIAITGTNGKSTVTSWLGHILKNLNLPCFYGGNLGVSPLEYIEEIKSRNKLHYIVLELSSYQIENLFKFRAYLGLILNIQVDHLDRYKDFDEYKNVKLKLWSLSTINLGLEFNKKLNIENIDLPELRLKGQHNLLYAKQILKICEILDFDVQLCKNYLSTFSGLNHRCQYVSCINYKNKKIDCYNDSKATNLSSSIVGINFVIENTKNKIILLVGGIVKDYPSILEEKSWIEAVSKNCRFVIGFGRDRDYYKNLVMKNNLNLYTASDDKSFDLAVKLAINLSTDGDSLLLSPGGSSLDEFNNFSERGDRFIQLLNLIS